MSAVMENDCDRLEVGSFYFINVNAWLSNVNLEGQYVKPKGRHGEVAIFGFQDIPGGMELFLTDRAWSEANKSFVENNVKDEGIIVMRTPPEGLPSGVAFGMGNNALVQEYNWVDYDVESPNITTEQYFHLGADGDQVFLYCMSGNEEERPIAGFSYNGAFLQNTNRETVFGTNTSAAPDYFYNVTNDTIVETPGLLVMRAPNVDVNKVFWNWEFQSPCGVGCVMDFEELRASMQDTKMDWLGTHADGSVSAPPRSAASPPLSWTNGGGVPHTFGLLVLVWLLVVV